VAKFYVNDPRNMQFETWAQSVNQDLSNFMSPVDRPDEKNWQFWAQQMFAADALVAEAIPNPNRFPDWKSWALQWMTNQN
jgi:hypothetical protein